MVSYLLSWTSLFPASPIKNAGHGGGHRHGRWTGLDWTTKVREWRRWEREDDAEPCRSVLWDVRGMYMYVRARVFASRPFSDKVCQLGAALWWKLSVDFFVLGWTMFPVRVQVKVSSGPPAKRDVEGPGSGVQHVSFAAYHALPAGRHRGPPAARDFLARRMQVHMYSPSSKNILSPPRRFT